MRRPNLRNAFPSRLLAAGFLFGLAAVRGLGAEPVLKVVSSTQTLTLSAADVHLLPHTELTALDPHEKKTHVYSGILVRDLLGRVGAPLGERLRGPALRMAVLVHARDGYGTLFALAEFDDAFSDRQLLLADSEDGKPLPESAGPFRLIVPGDKRAARWARMVDSIEVVPVGGPPP